MSLVRIILILGLVFTFGCGGSQPESDEEEFIPVNPTIPTPQDPLSNAELVASPGGSVNLGVQPVGSSTPLTITITNSGTGPASSIFTNPLPGDIHFLGGSYPGTAGTCGPNLSPGNSCDIVMEFLPTSVGVKTETLTMVYDDGASTQSLNIDFSGQGIAAAELEISNDPEYDFGPLTLGTSLDATLTVSNTGNGVATLIVPTGLSDDFEFKDGTYPGTGGDCTGSLGIGGTCEIVIKFSPQTVPEQSQTLRLTYDSGGSSVFVERVVKGSGVLPGPPSVTLLANDSAPTKVKNWNWGCSESCEYRFLVNQTSSHTFTTEPYAGTTSTSQPSGDGVYYIHVQARGIPYSVESAVVSVSAVLDNTAPTAPVINTVDNDATEQLAGTIHFTNGSDETQLSHYMMAVGTLGTEDDVVAYVNVGTVNPLQYDAGSFIFSNGTDYYTSLYTVDAAGNTSAVVTAATPWQPPGPPAAITNLAITNATPFTMTIGWTEPFNNFRPITDYLVEYKESSSGTWLVFNDGVSADTIVNVTGLSEQTSYDFRVTAYNGSQAPVSNTATGETTIDDPFFDPVSYKAMNLGGATASAVVNLGDADANIDIDRGGTIINLGTNVPPGGTVEFTSVQYDVAISDQPIFVAGRRGNAGAGANAKGNIVWNTPDWAGKEFIFNGTRDKPHKISFYSFEDSNTITFFKGATQIYQTSLDAGGADTYSLNDYGGFRIESTGLIVAYFFSNASGRTTDPKPLLPSSPDIIGFPSTKAFLAARFDSTGYNYYHSNSVSGSGSMNAADAPQLNAQGTSSLYRSEALRVISTDVAKPIVANSNADSNGYCSAPFLPVGMMKKRYGLNVETEWVAFASLEGGDITMIDTLGGETTHSMIQSGTDPYAPYRLRFTDLPAGTRFKADFRFAGWYEPKTDNYGAEEDETIMFGSD